MKRTLQELTIKDDFLFGAVMLEEANCRRLLELAAGISVRERGGQPGEELCVSSGIPRRPAGRLREG